MRRILSAAAVIMLSTIPVRVNADTCRFATPPTVIVDDGKQLLQYWEADDSALWRSGLPDSAGYRRFAQYVRARMDVSEPSRYLSLFKPKSAPDKHNTRLMLSEGIGRLGPLIDAVESDVEAGWKPFLNLHNHNFFFAQTPIVPGVPWPSAIDVQLMKTLSFKNLPFETTAVTNGFSTSHLRPDELKRFRGADEK